jgi:succinate dehydrogenase/fumarate reductase flavoprotein subunit
MADEQDHHKIVIIGGGTAGNRAAVGGLEGGRNRCLRW